MKKLRVLAVGAHPDDLEILCGGTLARYANEGHIVTMCVATDGSAGHMTMSPDELVRVREAEARASASVIGADLDWLGLVDEFVVDDRETRLRLVDAVRRAKPDLVITHAPNDYHHDHRIVSTLVTTASFMATLPNVKTELAPHQRVPPVYYMDTLAGHSFNPTEFVDITDTLATKKKMLACHESQLLWLSDHDATDMMDAVNVVAKARGFQSGATFAEGFKQEATWLRTPPTRLLP